MLGYSNDSLSHASIDSFAGRPSSKPTFRNAKKRETLNDVIEREWSELPYAMMRFGAARRPWDANRVYWRDRNVQLGDVDLNLITFAAQDDKPSYIAAFEQDGLRHDYTLKPSRKDGQLCWAAPGLADEKLTTEQLAQKLLGKLVTFYATGLTVPTSTASPGLSS